MELRASWGDLAAHLGAQGDPTKLCSLINLMPGHGAWRFVFTVDANSRLVAEVHQGDPMAQPYAVEAVFGGVVPETLKCEYAEYQVGATQYIVRDLTNALVIGNRNNELVVEEHAVPWQPGTHLRLVGYWPSESIPPSLATQTSVAKAFYEGTYLGSLKYSSPQKTLRWRVLGQPEVALTSAVVREWMQYAHEPFEIALSTELLNARLYAKKALQEIAIRYSDFGCTANASWFGTLITRLRSLGVPHSVVELDGPGCFNLTVFGRVLPGLDLRKQIGLLCDEAEASDAIRELRVRIQRKKRIQQAQDLSARIADARTGVPVLFNGEFICLAPRAEQATVALLAKLEGMGALPFAFRTRAWTTHVGIDLIADFCLTDDGFMKTDVPVELEYKFENFLTHGHPPQHVEMIVCWSVEGSEQRLRGDNRPWLFHYHADHRSIPVVALRHIPGLSVGAIQ